MSVILWHAVLRADRASIACQHLQSCSARASSSAQRSHRKAFQLAVHLRQAGLTNVVWADLGGDPKYGSVKKCLKFPGAGDFHPVRFRNEMVGNARCSLGMHAMCQPRGIRHSEV